MHFKIFRISLNLLILGLFFPPSSFAEEVCMKREIIAPALKPYLQCPIAIDLSKFKSSHAKSERELCLSDLEGVNIVLTSVSSECDKNAKQFLTEFSSIQFISGAAPAVKFLRDKKNIIVEISTDQSGNRQNEKETRAATAGFFKDNWQPKKLSKEDCFDEATNDKLLEQMKALAIQERKDKRFWTKPSPASKRIQAEIERLERGGKKVPCR